MDGSKAGGRDLGGVLGVGPPSVILLWELYE